MVHNSSSEQKEKMMTSYKTEKVIFKLAVDCIISFIYLWKKGPNLWRPTADRSSKSLWRLNNGRNLATRLVCWATTLTHLDRWKPYTVTHIPTVPFPSDLYLDVPDKKIYCHFYIHVGNLYHILKEAPPPTEGKVCYYMDHLIINK